MSLAKLFDKQRELDERIVKEKRLEGQDLLPEKILALQVELGELANEQRSWKFWSEDREPRISEKVECPYCIGTGDSNAEANMEQMMEGNTGYPYEACEDCGETGVAGYRNLLLEEYADCLSFILSMGLEYGCEDVKPAIRKTAVNFKGDELTAQFNEVMYRASGMTFVANKKTEYSYLVSNFIGLGEMLGFTWEQIEQAYYDKNKINHERQASGY